MASVIEFKLEDLAAAEGEAVEALLMGIGVSPNDCAGVDHHLEPGVLVDFLRSFPLRGVGGVPVPIEARTAAQIVSALQPGEELWVISRDKSARTPAELPEDHPGTGELRAKVKEQMIPLPLAHTAVQAAIAGYIATVDVTQQYHNPYDEKIEAVYVFPLPQDAAVNEFVMTVGERKIRGIIRERDEAEEIYEQAKSAGHVASLLTQERPNIFTQSVANIEPGKRIDISIKYFNTLAYADGWYEFVFPMVVGPRFDPPGSTDGVGAVARDKTGSSGQATEVPYLRPSERSGHDIAMTVRIDAGVSIEALDCVNHEITAEALDEARAVVQLDPADSIPNKDFILRYKVAGGHVKTAFVTHRDERGGFFTLMLVPPADLADLERKPMEMVFVLDCSGSMDGQPIAQAKAAAAQALRMMRPDDTFQIIRFSNNASQLGPAPLPATEANIARGLEYLASLEGSGGTMMIEGIRAALDFPHDPRRMRTVAFLTDGFIGNEAEILGEVYQRLGASRIFSFGVGSSPNRYLLDRLAALGKGAVAYLSLNGNAEEIMTLYFDRISHPGLTNLTIDWGTLNVHDVYPRRLPDLFVGRPVIVNGRFEGAEPTTIAIHGRVTDEERVYELDVDPTDVSAQHHGLAAVWARMKIKDLMTRNTYLKDDIELPQMIKEVALAYSLMSQYTAFVAVDSMTVTAGDHGTTVEVPVPVPEGVRYETTVVEDEVAAGVGS